MQSLDVLHEDTGSNKASMGFKRSPKRGWWFLIFGLCGCSFLFFFFFFSQLWMFWLLHNSIVFFSLPEDYRCGKSLGPVESLQEHPQLPGKILIGYNRGLVVLWDLNARHPDHLFLGKQVSAQRTTLCASESGCSFCWEGMWTNLWV